MAEGKVKHVAELDMLVHVFSHLKLFMYIQLFTIDKIEGGDEDKSRTMDGDGAGNGAGPKRRWVDTEDMDGQTLSTGMRRCWAVVVKRRKLLGNG